MIDIQHFAALPAVIPALFDRFDTVVCVLLDGFGAHLLERLRARQPLWRALTRTAHRQRIQAQFPSTTAAQLTTLHTGLPVGRSGVPEWWYFEPTLGRPFSPLRHHAWSSAGPVPVSSARSPLPVDTLYTTLARRGVKSFCVQPRAYSDSTYTRRVCRGATRVPHDGTAHLFDRLTDLLAPQRYVFGYLDVIDALSHTHGPYSTPVEHAAATIARALDAWLARGLLACTCVLLTADHGLTPTDDEVVYVDAVVPSLPRWIARLPDGAPIAPTGGKRDVFLHVRPGALDAAHDACCVALDGVARVLRVDDAVAEGVFGAVLPEVRPRLGDLLVLPAPHRRIWWALDGARPRGGDHGGRTPEEMEIPLLIWA